MLVRNVLLSVGYRGAAQGDEVEDGRRCVDNQRALLTQQKRENPAKLTRWTEPWESHTAVSREGSLSSQRRIERTLATFFLEGWAWMRRLRSSRPRASGPAQARASFLIRRTRMSQTHREQRASSSSSTVTASTFVEVQYSTVLVPLLYFTRRLTPVSVD